MQGGKAHTSDDLGPLEVFIGVLVQVSKALRSFRDLVQLLQQLEAVPELRRTK